MVDITKFGDTLIWIGSVLGAIIAILAIFTKPIKKIINNKKIKKEKDNTLYENIDAINLAMEETVKQNANQALAMEDFLQRLNNLSNRVDANEIDRIRWEILYFSNMCRRQERISIDEFQHIFMLHDKYEQLIQANGLTNGYMDTEMAFLRALFTQYSAEGKFKK